MGDPDFESAVDRFYAGLYSFALSLARNEPEAWDLTHQTFSVWAKKSYQLREPSKLKSWLFRTLYREFLGSRRRQKRFPERELEVCHEELPPIASTVANDVDGKTIVQALQGLDEEHRAALTLFYLRDHSYREIAEVLDIPIGTVMSRLARGKQALREALREPGRDGKTISFPDSERKQGDQGNQEKRRQDNG
jgi:RNA polymerase sigma-70 factor (ECF subfamily)